MNAPIRKPLTDLERACPQYADALRALDRAIARNAPDSEIEKLHAETARIAEAFNSGREHARQTSPAEGYDTAIPDAGYTARVTNALPNAVAEIVETAKCRRAWNRRGRR